MDTPWKKLAAPEQEREYLALLSYLPLKSYFAMPKFMSHAMKIQKQLRDTPGIAGYSLRAELLSRRFWTLSAWESNAALMEFVKKNPHGDSMRAMVGDMGKTGFTQWKVKGRDLPLRWDEAMRREAQGALG
jgi:hypothetical protein